MPNLALMKLSTFYKSKGYDVTFIDLSSFEIDSWFGSKIFTGGSGINLEQDLPDEIEILTPDYEKFKLNYSIGFTSRGCIRKCDFCIVKEKEGMIKEVNMDWIKHSKVILLDNNFLASPKWREKLEYFIDNNGVLANKKLEPEKLIHECSKLNTEKDVNLLDQYLGE